MNKKTAVFLILSVAITGLVISEWMFNKPHASVRNEEAAFKLSATELVDAFSKDESQANSLYNGKILEVNGMLKDKLLNESSVILMMGDETNMTGVSCYLQDKDKDKYLTLKTGGQVRVKGICNGFLLDVVLDKCILLQQEE